jgi:polar amino acid transport system substrate-binding protein
MPLHRIAALCRARAVALGAALLLAPAAVAGPVLERITETGQLRLGFRTDAPPFASLVEGRPEGFSIDLCALVARAIKDTSGLDHLTARFSPVGTGQRFEALARGEIDIECGASTATLSRREIVSFSIPMFLTGVSALMRADAPELAREVLIEASPAAFSETVVRTALKGRRFGVRRDTTAEDWLRDAGMVESGDVAVEAFETHASGIDALAAGEIDGYFADRAILMGELRARGEPDGLVLSKKTFTQEPYALAIPRGDEDFRLVVDRALSHIYRTGAVLELIERHFGQPAADVVLFYRLMALPD